MKALNKKIFAGICILLLVITLFSFIYTGRDFGSQAMNAMYLSSEFKGEYKVGDGDWQPYVKGKHIPADKGEVTLKGNFILFVPTTGEVIGNAPEGVILAFYFNHIGGEVSEGGEEFRPFDAESDLIGEMEVPVEALYGVQTLRGIENFPISRFHLSDYPCLSMVLQ